MAQFEELRLKAVLVGPPGVGKSTVVRSLPHAVDLDGVIASRTGRTPAQWIRESGECAFRDVEREELLAVLNDSSVDVIAAGAGIVERADNRFDLKQRASVIHLDAPVEALLPRVSAHPLCVGDDGRLDRAAYVALVSRRRALYAQVAHRTVDAGGDRESTTQRLRACLATIGHGIFPDEVAFVRAGGTIAEPAHWQEQLHARTGLILRDRNCPVKATGRVIDLDGGEFVKSEAGLKSILEVFAAYRVDRDDHVVVLGGGALLDAVGFAAAIWHRGVRWTSVPTTPLAMLDAGFGGKTAVNWLAKNQLGAFHAPERVVVVPDWLGSFGREQRRHAAFEAIKHWALCGEGGAPGEFSAWLDGFIDGEPAALVELLRFSLAVKARVVAADPADRGIRRALNFGHAFGHALERELGIGHGLAVGYGMRATLALTQALNEGDGDWCTELSRSALPTLKLAPEVREKLLLQLVVDKNSRRTGMSVVTCLGRGRPMLRQLAEDERPALLSVLQCL